VGATPRQNRLGQSLPIAESVVDGQEGPLATSTPANSTGREIRLFATTSMRRRGSWLTATWGHGGRPQDRQGGAAAIDLSAKLMADSENLVGELRRWPRCK
jgi:hypothetical protein